MKKGKGKNSGLLPNSLRIISSCLKTVSTNASTVASTVRSAGASVAASISSASEDQKDQVTWAGFDKLDLGPGISKHVLLLGYLNGFQVLDVEDASNFSELVSKHDCPVSFLQMQPFPAVSDGVEGFRKFHPLLLVVVGEDTTNANTSRSHLDGAGKDGTVESQSGKGINSPKAVRFYSLKCHSYVHVLRFRSMVCMIRCSPRIVAVGLASQIYCFDALTLENKFSVLTYPVPLSAGQGTTGVNVGYGPLALGPRWLAYASNSPLPSNSGHLSPQNFTPPGSASQGTGSLVARYAKESSKHLAAGIINLGDMGYKTLSRYCQELLPDGSSSPIQPNAGWKVGKIAGIDTDNAGVVVVKDCVTRAVVSQFKAHTSPISALCFDPSGTLLVTASVYGNNINIFRIMPFCSRRGSYVQGHDINACHVHLYKLHRGITSALIEDICFSHFSQWIAIVSSKGTCHLFVLAPFGGDAGFQIVNSQGDELYVLPVLSPPWWSNSASMTDQQQFSSPPSPVVLSVVTRIKYSSFGWLNTFHNSTPNATGKVFVPSGALAAVFHNSLSFSRQHLNSKVKSLEHILVYTPSGHVVQHELLSSVGMELGDSSSSFQSFSYVQAQDDEFRVRVEPIQWWDVCRRSELDENEDFGTYFDRSDGYEINQEKTSCGDGCGGDCLNVNGGGKGTQMVKDCVKFLDRSHVYLSNAEVQVFSGTLPVWQKSKIYFYMIDSLRGSSNSGGEYEIEKFPVNEIEIRRKELLPVFDHFHGVKPNWSARGLEGGRYTNSTSSVSNQAEDKITAEETVICFSKPASLSSTESSDGGSSRRNENLLDLDQLASSFQIHNEVCQQNSGTIIAGPSLHDQKFVDNFSSSIERLRLVESQTAQFVSSKLAVKDGNIIEVQKDNLEKLSSTCEIGEASALAYHDIPKTKNLVDLPSTIPIQSHIEQPPLKEAVEHRKHVLDEVVIDKLDEDEGGEMLGGMFPFSEEGGDFSL